jgi:lipoprotein LprG
MKTRALAAALVPLLIAVGACSGGGGKGDGKPGDVLASAKKALDSTSGVRLQLTTPQMPKGVSGVTKADGIATHDPAFMGDIDIVYSGLKVSIKVIATGGVVYAVLPYTTKYVEVTPSDYNAPDPAGLMDPDAGISGWLTKATDVAKDKSVRDGNEVLTSYTGKLNGAAIVSAIPSADDKGSYDAIFTIDSKGRLRKATVTGAFYKGKPKLTYDVTITDYGTKKDIKAPGTK